MQAVAEVELIQLQAPELVERVARSIGGNGSDRTCCSRVQHGQQILVLVAEAVHQMVRHPVQAQAAPVS
jgi:hypothetical protein